jgi:hypothetical protein
MKRQPSPTMSENGINSNSASTISSTSNTEPLTQAEADITISSYSIVQLDYGSSRHPDFIKLDATDVVREFHQSSLLLNNPKKKISNSRTNSNMTSVTAL